MRMFAVERLVPPVALPVTPLGIEKLIVEALFVLLIVWVSE